MFVFLQPFVSFGLFIIVFTHQQNNNNNNNNNDNNNNSNNNTTTTTNNNIIIILFIRLTDPITKKETKSSQPYGALSWKDWGKCAYQHNNNNNDFTA